MSSGAAYLRLEKVGHGTYGEVFKGKDRRSGAAVALKRIKSGNADEGVPSTALREVALLRELSAHPNIVRCVLGGVWQWCWPERRAVFGAVTVRQWCIQRRATTRCLRRSLCCVAAFRPSLCGFGR